MRILPEHFRRDGKAKQKLSRTAAEKAAKKNHNMNAYRCTVCNAWHVGNK